VIVQVGAWPQATSKALVASRRAFIKAVQRGADASTGAHPPLNAAPQVPSGK
jgi:hypothetical protein